MLVVMTQSLVAQSDDDKPNPFVKLDGLAKKINDVDEVVSALIGRLTPYCTPAFAGTTLNAQETAVTISPFEEAIERQRVAVDGILQSLLELNERLRL